MEDNTETYRLYCLDMEDCGFSGVTNDENIEPICPICYGVLLIYPSWEQPSFLTVNNYLETITEELDEEFVDD